MTRGFETEVLKQEDGTLVGPWRTPRQMLMHQEYDGHPSIHDDATAQQLGFKGGTIEGPTHFSQFEPLAMKEWGLTWFETGCISVHYRTAAFEGEETQAKLKPSSLNPGSAEIWMTKRDGTEVLRGTASTGISTAATALELRLTALPPIQQRVILRDVEIGMKDERCAVQMNFDQQMGAYYPFTLKEKLSRITETSDLWLPHADSPFGAPIIPMEMVSVLLSQFGQPFPVRGPSIGLFADQEIRLLNGPLFVSTEYEMERELVALSGSKRTESMWIKTTLYGKNDSDPIATMLLNVASIKASYPRYELESGGVGVGV